MAIKQYTAVSGDYLYKIAMEHGTTVGAIWNHELNYDHRLKRESPEYLYPGDVLYIPVPDELISEPPLAPPPITPLPSEPPGLIAVGTPPSVPDFNRRGFARAKTVSDTVARLTVREFTRLHQLPDFYDLWNAHPEITEEDDFCDHYRGTQCSMKLGHAIHVVDPHVLQGCRSPRCRPNATGEHAGHTTSPRNLVTYLGSPRVWGPIEKYLPDDVPRDRIYGRTGIVYFYWIHPSRTSRMDHVDLWEWNRTTRYDKPGGSEHFYARETWFIEVPV